MACVMNQANKLEPDTQSTCEEDPPEMLYDIQDTLKAISFTKMASELNEELEDGDFHQSVRIEHYSNSQSAYEDTRQYVYEYAEEIFNDSAGDINSSPLPKENDEKYEEDGERNVSTEITYYPVEYTPENLNGRKVGDISTSPPHKENYEEDGE